MRQKIGGIKTQELSKLTVVHTATLDATKSVGMLRVNCDFVAPPNMKYPIVAAPAYSNVQRPKLHHQPTLIS